jgi:hypothetical protein
MSLTAFLDVPAHRDRFKPLRPDASILRRTLPPIRIKSTDPKRTYLIGTAIDYLFRIEVQQRAAWAIDTGWVAERIAGKLICTSTRSIGLRLHRQNHLPSCCGIERADADRSQSTGIGDDCRHFRRRNASHRRLDDRQLKAKFAEELVQGISPSDTILSDCGRLESDVGRIRGVVLIC